MSRIKTTGRRLFVYNRNWHRQAAVIAALPLLITIVTGIILMVRSDFDWIQPKARVGVTKLVEPQVSFEEILTKLKALPEAEVKDWGDVSSVNFNPGKGIFQVRLKNLYEIQFDASNGQLLNSQFRTTSVLVELHQGSFFHPLVMKWVFLPAGVLLLLLWVSGMYLWIFPKLSKANKAGKSQSSEGSKKALNQELNNASELSQEEVLR